jgi:hypothetical protein
VVWERGPRIVVLLPGALSETLGVVEEFVVALWVGRR